MTTPALRPERPIGFISHEDTAKNTASQAKGKTWYRATLDLLQASTRGFELLLPRIHATSKVIPQAGLHMLSLPYRGSF